MGLFIIPLGQLFKYLVHLVTQSLDSPFKNSALENVKVLNKKKRVSDE
jgi:hypothetical protein